MEKIGMIGTGAMGLALLERLEVGGVNAVCYDAYAPALEQARALGMRVVGSAAEVAAESTLIDIVVRTDEDVVDCVIGARGVLANAQPGTLLLLHSSILPQTMIKAGQAASGRLLRRRRIGPSAQWRAECGRPRSPSSRSGPR